MKQTKVELITVSDGAKRTFDIEHAERILAMRNSGWALPADSEFELKDGTIIKRDKGKDK